MGLHPFRLTNPGLGGERLEFDSKDLALSGVFTALYVVINVVQMVSVGNPTIYGPIQLRVADCLIAIAALLGYPVIIGVTVGCFLTNAYYFIGPQDVVLGPIANLAAASVVFALRKHRLAACVAGAFPVGIIVGGYLWLFFPPPEVLNVLPVWAGMIVSITVSSLVSVGVIGYLLLSLLSKPGVIEPLRSRGLKIADNN
ncbi:MAG TPA: QueT transporter family protein [Candidatus Bathyarchaeota archaeon]|nr:QueT transporter family protein [Candidatus Bathyarchaeota archaeon]